jgi:hypothetical protein
VFSTVYLAVEEEALAYNFETAVRPVVVAECILYWRHATENILVGICAVFPRSYDVFARTAARRFKSQ